MKLNLWATVVQNEITAYLKDGSVCTGSAIVCNDIDETERGERLLTLRTMMVYGHTMKVNSKE